MSSSPREELGSEPGTTWQSARLPCSSVEGPPTAPCAKSRGRGLTFPGELVVVFFPHSLTVGRQVTAGCFGHDVRRWACGQVVTGVWEALW